MSTKRIAIYSCHLPYNEETKLLDEQIIRDVQRQLERDEIIGVFEDVCAATTPLAERTELKKLLEMAKRREIDEIAVPQVKRLAKSIELMVDIFNKFRKTGATIKCFREGINNYSLNNTTLEIVMHGLKMPESEQNETTKNVILYYGYEHCEPECEEEHRRNVEDCIITIEEDKTSNLVKTIVDRKINDIPIMERDGVKSLIEECTSRKVDMVYTPTIETFAPVTQDFIRIYQELEKLEVGVKIIDSELTMQCDEETNFTMTMM